MTASSIGSDIRYSAFLSYSHQDERWARWLQRALETYRVPSHLVGMQTAAGTITRRLAPVFRDRSDLPSATDLNATINEALRASASLIVICSPSASRSRWVNEEIAAYRRLGRANRIYCLIVAGEPNASDMPRRQDEECLPPALRYYEGTDAQTSGPRLEPIAADVRAGGDGRTNAKLKIISGMLDVGFDVLKRREHRRRYQRMTMIAALAVIVMLITTGLAIDAQIARRAAEQRQKEAEALVAFMLGDLNDKLRQVQRLDILEAVDNHSMAYFLSRPMRELSDPTLLLRVKALQKIGNVREDQGKLPAAMDSYRAAAALAAELVRRAPGDSDRLSVYAATLIHTGYGYWFQGELEPALACFQKAIELLERGVAARPSEDSLAALSTARTNAGRVLEARGDFAAAKALYEQVSETFKTLAAHEPRSVHWQSGLADAYDSLGKILLEQGQLTQAIAAYRDVRGIRTQLLAQSPDDRDLQESLLVSNAILGRTLALCGADTAAVHYVGEAVTAATALVAFDATQVDWREELARYSILLGGLARSAGHFDEAGRRDSDGLRVLTALAATDKTNRSWQQELASARIELGRLQLATAHAADAQHTLEAANATLSGERTARPADRELRLLDTQAHIVLGQLSAAQNDKLAAHDHWTRAHEVISSAAQVGADPNYLVAWASALLLLDNTDAAHAVVERLASMGYQTSDFDLILAAKQQRYRPKPLAQRCGPGQLSDPWNTKLE